MKNVKVKKTTMAARIEDIFTMPQVQQYNATELPRDRTTLCNIARFIGRRLAGQAVNVSENSLSPIALRSFAKGLYEASMWTGVDSDHPIPAEITSAFEEAYDHTLRDIEGSYVTD